MKFLDNSMELENIILSVITHVWEYIETWDEGGSEKSIEIPASSGYGD